MFVKGKQLEHLNALFPRLFQAIPPMSFLHGTDYGNFDIHQLTKIHKCGNKRDKQ